MKKILLAIYALLSISAVANAQVISVYKGNDVVGTYITTTNTTYKSVLGKSPKVTVTSMVMNPALITVDKDKSFNLKATASPSSACQNFTWTSSDVAVATVDADGNVTSTGLGSATITATAIDGSNKTATCAVTVSETSSRLLSGVFSVDGNGTNVKFTGGNLYWDGSSYHLEDTQYDYQTSWNYQHVDKFFWTSYSDYTSEGKDSVMPYNSVYKYVRKADGTDARTGSDKFWCGEDHKLTVDNVANLFALTSTQWNYLIGRTDASGNKLVKYGVSVAGKSNCLVIAPDSYDGAVLQDKTSYTAAEWATAEASGLVCLPAAGYRNGTGFNNVGSYGYYCTSSPNGASFAYNLGFYSGSVNMYRNSRYYGFTVRLVALSSD